MIRLLLDFQPQLVKKCAQNCDCLDGSETLMEKCLMAGICNQGGLLEKYFIKTKGQKSSLTLV
jgi:hypothetical protein